MVFGAVLMQDVDAQLTGVAYGFSTRGAIQFGKKDDMKRGEPDAQEIQDVRGGVNVWSAAHTGRPTIAYRAGGATETILDGCAGVFFLAPVPEALVD
jgi:hypothetical protein